MVAGVFHEKNPTSDSWSAKSTGRLDVGFLLIMLLLSLMHNLFSNQVLGSPYTTALHIACGLIWYYMQTMMLVHPIAWVNSVMAAFAASYLWMGITLAIAQGHGTYSSSRQDYSALVLLGGVVAGIAGGTLAFIRQATVTAMRLEEFSSASSTVHDLNAWIRARLRRVAKLEALGDSTTTQAYAQAAVLEDDEKDASRGKSPSADTSAGGDGQSNPDGPSGNSSSSTGIASAADRMSRLRVLEQKRLLREAFRGMNFLMTQFPQSELACMFASVGFRDHSPWLYHEAMALARARSLPPSLDVLFHIYQRSGQLRETGAEDSSPVDRVLFD